MRAHMRMVVAAVALAMSVAGCGKKHDRDEAAGPPKVTISPEEKKLATDACNDYVAKLCACAEKKPELAETCKLKHAKPEALALALGVVADPSSSADSVARARSEVGKIVARCIEEAAQLPALGCP